MVREGGRRNGVGGKGEERGREGIEREGGGFFNLPSPPSFPLSPPFPPFSIKKVKKEEDRGHHLLSSVPLGNRVDRHKLDVISSHFLHNFTE